MKLLKICEICKSDKIRFLLQQSDKNHGFDEEFSLYQCKNCGVIFLNPQLNMNELEKYYSRDKYYSFGKIDKSSKKLKLKLLLYNTYFNSLKNNLFMKALLLPLKFIIRGTKIKKGLKLLDIGSGSGQFMYEMKKLGLNVMGIEPGDFIEVEAKRNNLDIKKSTLEETRFGENLFDIITLNQVLEHIHNPKEILGEIRRILKKRGLFLVAVPNPSSLAYKIFKKNWYQLDIPRHIFIFPDRLLVKILSEEGFKVIKVRHNSRPSQFSVSLQYLLGIKNKKFEKILDVLFLPLTWLVNALKVGDQIEVWCEKR